MNDTIDAPPSGMIAWGDAGSVGDYIDRQDNKPGPINKARHFESCRKAQLQCKGSARWI